MNRKLGLSIVSGLILILLVAFVNITIKGPRANVIITGSIERVCNIDFVNFAITSAPAGVRLIKNTPAIAGLKLAPQLPGEILKNDPNLAITVEIRGNSNLPIMPDLPILPLSQEAKLCPMVQDYVAGFPKAKANILAAQTSNVFQLTPYGDSLSVSMRLGYQVAVTQRSLQEYNKDLTFKADVENKARTRIAGQNTSRPIPAYDFLIVYQEDYESEVYDMQLFYEQLGVRTKTMRISSLPGYRATDPIPTECYGEFLNECYHFWGDPAPGVSQFAVPSLHGYAQQTTALQQYQKVPFVPGLIRAYTRTLHKIHPLKGVLLVGSAHKIPPYFTTTQSYYYDGLPSLPGKPTPSIYVPTNAYYSIPSVPLIASTDVMAHEILTPGMWTCGGPNGTRLDYYCKSDEWRHWPTPPLIAYRNPAHIPQGKLYRFKYAQGNSFWSTLSYNDVIPVGRIVTQENNMKAHDPVVANYVGKLRRWYNEMPSMKNNSVLSNAGSTGDYWIYLKEDIDSFLDTFGSGSKVYASEFFVSSSKCAGRCIYSNGEAVMTTMSQKNMAAFMLNGHGGHIAIQAPYGNGNVESSFRSEGSVSYNDRIQPVLTKYPSESTIKQFFNSGRLVGVVFANSCSPSNFMLVSESYKINKELYPESDQRSWAEQWIAAQDGGAMNTYLNHDVGWSYSDNQYNIAFIQRLKSSWAACGTIGDAYSKTLLDGLQSGGLIGIGQWQYLNRIILGSPINHFARLPWRCTAIVGKANITDSKETL